MQDWLKRAFERAEKEYEALPEWKKKLWKKEEFLKEQNTSKIPQKRYDTNDWT
jgi:hypothetical protein